MRSRSALVFVALGCLACSSEHAAETEPPPPTPPELHECAVGEREIGRDDEGAICQPPGIPSDGCAEGFSHDGVAVCEPILPDMPCTDGMMAVPGEDSCRSIVTCAGLPASEPDSQHVDQAYTGGTSDGTAMRPWLTIQQAVDAAASGASVLVAAGSYAEAVSIGGKSVRLWGTCPSEVTIDGGNDIAVAIITGADNSEIHNVGLTGGSAAAVVTNAAGVLLDSLWAHDTGNTGISIEASLGHAEATLHNVLIERSTRRGLFVSASTATLEGVVIRDVLTQGPSTGWGVIAISEVGRAALTVRGSLVERVTQFGIGGQAADVTVEGSVIRDVAAVASEGFGRAIEMQASQSGGGHLVVRGSLVERAQDAGVLVFGSSAAIENTVARNNLPDLAGRRGAGFTIENDWMFGFRSAGSITNSVADNNTSSGVIVIGSDVTIEGLLVRDTQVSPNGQYGRGIGIEEDTGTNDIPIVTVSASAVERSVEAGVAMLGAQVTLDNVRVSDSRARADGLFGDGITLLSPLNPASAIVRGSHVEAAERAGISNFGGALDLGSSRLECNPIDLNGADYGEAPFSFVDASDNRCGCEADEQECKLQTVALEPPVAL